MLQLTYYKKILQPEKLRCLNKRTFKQQVTLCMIFIKNYSLKSNKFFNVIFISCFSGSRFFRVQVFQGPDFSGSGFSESESRVWVQVLEAGFL